MPQYQLRVYTLRSPEALVAYENIWAKHIPGMAKHRINTHGVWTVPATTASEAPQLYALVSYQDADDVQERLEAYLSSPNSARTWRASTSARSSASPSPC
ncbi:NIPSNAP family protein [Streptomyces sp. NBC_01280]|uniref:NIPSNAP family protein n=1 Tax=unclassified Streptomyces TaxID=2593676 RepID=UPI002E3451BB|nr:NIPSNAP family protein [Streptomyces sp. NBC_01280]WSE12695.1 NIPSNAP family protein [Streptomyces sp. NBC_01397]